MEGDLGSAFQKGKTLLTKNPVVRVHKMSLGDSELISLVGVECDRLKS